MDFRMLEMNGCIFDMDGTVFDTQTLAIKVFVDAGHTFDRTLEPDFLLKLAGTNTKAMEKLMKVRYGEEFPFVQINEKALELMSAHLARYGMPIKTGVIEVLEFLADRNIPMAIATSTQRDVTERYLLISKLRHYFDVVVCGNDVERSKPEPDIFLRAAGMIDCEPHECAVVEDSENGILAAYRAGAIPILVKDIEYPGNEVRTLAYAEYEDMTGFYKDLAQI